MWLFNNRQNNESRQDSQSSQNETVHLTIGGMHCVSCGLNVDGTLEDLPGVAKAQTDYAKGISKIEYEPSQISVDQMITAVEGLGYQARLK